MRPIYRYGTKLSLEPEREGFGKIGAGQKRTNFTIPLYIGIIFKFIRKYVAIRFQFG